MYERGRFGIEYNPRSTGAFGRPTWGAPWRGWPWLLAVLALGTLVSFCHTTVKRWRTAKADKEAVAQPAAPQRPAAAPSAPSVPPRPAVAPPPPPKPVVVDTRRPARVTNLLMRLDEAERQRNAALAASTIEQLLALPGNPVADLEDKLRRRLGNLNLAALLEGKSAKWVANVTVKRGDAPIRIAREYASTYASLVKLNGEKTLAHLKPGQVLKVMNKPRFNLVVHRRMRIADLELDGKFFRRYDLQGAVAAKPGVYEVPERLRPFLDVHGIAFKPADRSELEMLVPKGASVVVSEL